MVFPNKIERWVFWNSGILMSSWPPLQKTFLAPIVAILQVIHLSTIFWNTQFCPVTTFQLVWVEICWYHWYPFSLLLTPYKRSGRTVSPRWIPTSSPRNSGRRCGSGVKLWHRIGFGWNEWNTHMYLYTYTHTYIYTYINTYIYIYTHIYIYIFNFIYVYRQIIQHIHIYICILGISIVSSPGNQAALPPFGWIFPRLKGWPERLKPAGDAVLVEDWLRG